MNTIKALVPSKDLRVLIDPGQVPDQGTIYKSLAPVTDSTSEERRRLKYVRHNPPVGTWGQDITNMNDHQIVALVLLVQHPSTDEPI
ncbi:uncharacterized protein FPOAC1_013450 [Fusarium poae]|uniref:uncharacterized protein n=1 Tax=Fusarium poae TaxID=36050 RepID=UPI001D04280F|nr:uncharacterized protein FPOAC1_013450 [Fusarium poae]KAG8664670.1 hypothetical protein FPOAC1_013450 [Fusarium poae]